MGIESPLESTPATRKFLASLAAQDFDSAASTAEDHWVELWYAIDPTDLRGLIEQLPCAVLDGRDKLRYLASSAGLDLDAPEYQGWSSVEAQPSASDRIGELFADLRLQGRPVEALTHVPVMRSAIQGKRGSLLDGSQGELAVLQVQVGIAALLAGDLNLARAELLQASNAHKPTRYPFVVRDAIAKLALSHAASGHVREAVQWNLRAREHRRSHSWVESLVDDSIWLTDYICAVDLLDLDRAEELRLERPSPLSHLEFWGFALQAQVRHLVLTDRSVQAETLCRDVEQGGLPLPGSDGALATMVEDARLTISLQGRSGPAAEAQDHSTPATVLAKRVRLVATGQFELAAMPMMDTRVPTTDQRPLVALDLLRAQSLMKVGRTEEGRRLLRSTLKKMVDLGALSPLRYLVSDLLDEVMEGVRDEPWGAEAMALVQAHRIPTVEVIKIVAVPLSAAEIEVMRLLQWGMSRQQIADKLFISLSTVKTHLAAAYRKLEVRTREHAVERFDQLGL